MRLSEEKMKMLFCRHGPMYFEIGTLEITTVIHLHYNTMHYIII